MSDDDKRMLVQLTVGELRAMIREEVDRAVRPILETKPAQPSGRWTDIAGIAKRYQCTPQTIRNWIRAGAPALHLPPAHRPMIRIDIAEFEAWADLAKRPVR